MTGHGRTRIFRCFYRVGCGCAGYLRLTGVVARARLARSTAGVPVLSDELNGPHTDVCSRCDSPRTRPRWQRLTLAPARQSVATSHSPQIGNVEGEGIAQVRALSGARLSDALSLRQRHNPADATSEARSYDGSGQRYDRLDLLCTLRERTVVVVDNPAGARAKRGVSTGSLSSTTRPRPHCDLTDAPRTPARDPRRSARPSGFVRLHARARAL